MVSSEAVVTTTRAGVFHALLGPVGVAPAIAAYLWVSFWLAGLLLVVAAVALLVDTLVVTAAIRNVNLSDARAHRIRMREVAAMSRGIPSPFGSRLAG